MAGIIVLNFSMTSCGGGGDGGGTATATTHTGGSSTEIQNTTGIPASGAPPAGFYRKSELQTADLNGIHMEQLNPEGIDKVEYIVVDPAVLSNLEQLFNGRLDGYVSDFRVRTNMLDRMGVDVPELGSRKLLYFNGDEPVGFEPMASRAECREV